jgi:hypothetical protein
MRAPVPASPTRGRRTFADLTAPGRSSFDWAILFAALALAIPISGLIGVVFADRSRRQGYGRWKAAMAVSLWCVIVGLMVRGFLRAGVFP